MKRMRFDSPHLLDSTKMKSAKIENEYFLQPKYARKRKQLGDSHHNDDQALVDVVKKKRIKMIHNKYVFTQSDCKAQANWWFTS